MATNSLLDKLRDGLRAFRSARGGNVIGTFALALIPLVGTVGAAVDYSRANSVKAHMQKAADVAALYAASGNYASDADRIAAGVNAFNANYSAQFAAVSPQVTTDSSTVTVTAAAAVDTTLLKIVGFRTVPANVTAIAQFDPDHTACVLALQRTDDGVSLDDEAAFSANCGLYANSKSYNAVQVSSSSHIKASSTCVVGGYIRSKGSALKPLPHTGCPALADPLEVLPVPPEASDACAYNNYSVTSSATLSPGVYCGGLTIASGASVTFLPGTYVIRDGQLSIGSAARATGNNVLLHLTGQNASFAFGSESHIAFTAPTAGTYKGIVLFQSPNVTGTLTANTFSSESTSVLQGAVYTPNGDIVINCEGTVGASADYTVWVVKRLLVHWGTLRVTSNYGGSSTPLPDPVVAMVTIKAVLIR